MAHPGYAAVIVAMRDARTWADLRVAQRLIFTADVTDQQRGWLWDAAARANDNMWGRSRWVKDLAS